MQQQGCTARSSRSRLDVSEQQILSRITFRQGKTTVQQQIACLLGLTSHTSASRMDLWLLKNERECNSSTQVSLAVGFSWRGPQPNGPLHPSGPVPAGGTWSRAQDLQSQLWALLCWLGCSPPRRRRAASAWYRQQVLSTCTTGAFLYLLASMFSQKVASLSGDWGSLADLDQAYEVRCQSINPDALCLSTHLVEDCH